ncbi:dynein regulatory complex subunit 4-like isoform X2 [Thalassophryne amazonica]|uniref:dynein regulatory complex subunit 4-like isoform X2 n=1 Tax=Thalassophryne amazonica TaxID=390379 RepID=UPI001470AF78|nr:dynein regulatory complex subunit 4-like isoform X2 [Thalassophryne amazonica]
MPPKLKDKSNTSAKARTPTLINGRTKEEVSKEQMEEHIMHLQEELDREREERNYFQLERDQIHNFWEITERQLDETQALLKNLNKEIEEAEGRHQVEIKVYKQKMKHLLCEHQNTMSELRADHVVSIEAIQKDQAVLENELLQGMSALKVDIQEAPTENLQELKMKHDKEKTEMKNKLETQLSEIKAKYEQKYELLLQELDNKRKADVSEFEDQKNSHITCLINNHKKALTDYRADLQKQKVHDLDLNNSLSAHVEELKLKEMEKKAAFADISLENKCLTSDPKKAIEEVAKLQKRLKFYEKDKNMLVTLRAHLKAEEKALNNQMWEAEVLEQRFNMLQLERDGLYQAFTQSILNVQQRRVTQSLLAERKLGALTETLEKAEAQVSSVISACDLDRTAHSGATNKIEEIVQK